MNLFRLYGPPLGFRVAQSTSASSRILSTPNGRSRSGPITPGIRRANPHHDRLPRLSNILFTAACLHGLVYCKSILPTVLLWTVVLSHWSRHLSLCQAPRLCWTDPLQQYMVTKRQSPTSPIRCHQLALLLAVASVLSSYKVT